MQKMPNVKLEEQEVIEPLEEDNVPDIKEVKKETPFVELEPIENQEKKQEKPPVAPNLNVLTKKALNVLCKEKGIRGYSKLSKPNLIRVLQGEEPIVNKKEPKKEPEKEPKKEPEKESEKESEKEEISKNVNVSHDKKNLIEKVEQKPQLNKPKKIKKNVKIENPNNLKKEKPLINKLPNRTPPPRETPPPRCSKQAQIPPKPLYNPFKKMYNIQ